MPRSETPTIAEIVSNDFQILHGCAISHPPRVAAFASFSRTMQMREIFAGPPSGTGQYDGSVRIEERFRF